jgi:hypothetical protein
VVFEQVTGGSHTFYTGTAEIMFINTSGAFVIGTTLATICQQIQNLLKWVAKHVHSQ